MRMINSERLIFDYMAQGVKWPSMNSGGFLRLQENLQRLPSSTHEDFRALTQTLNKKFDM